VGWEHFFKRSWGDINDVYMLQMADFGRSPLPAAITAYIGIVFEKMDLKNTTSGASCDLLNTIT